MYDTMPNPRPLGCTVCRTSFPVSSCFLFCFSNGSSEEYSEESMYFMVWDYHTIHIIYSSKVCHPVHTGTGVWYR